MNRPRAGYTVNIAQFGKVNGSGVGDHTDVPALVAFKDAMSEMTQARYKRGQVHNGLAFGASRPRNFCR